MILTIWRHGEAGSAACDYERQLTPRGTDDISRGAVRFAEACRKRAIPYPELIAHSPWVRTNATARLIADEFAQARILPCEAVQPGSDTAIVEAYLNQSSPNDEVEHMLLVSHQPLVSGLIDHFLGERGRVPALTPGGLASLSLSFPAQGCGQLLFWSFPPEYASGL